VFVRSIQKKNNTKKEIPITSHVQVRVPFCADCLHGGGYLGSGQLADQRFEDGQGLWRTVHGLVHEGKAFSCQ